MEHSLNQVEKAEKFHCPQGPVTDVAKGDIKKIECKALEAVCQGCNKKGHFEKVCLSAKHSTHLLEVPQASTSSMGAGEPLYFDDQGQPIFTQMVEKVCLSAKHSTHSL